jgi:hypothetical protein
MSYTPNPKDPTTPTDAADSSQGASEFRALKQYIAQLVAAGGTIVTPQANQSGLTNLLYPSNDGWWQDIYRGGWMPAFFNQQWGGAQWGHLPDGSYGDIATGYISDNSNTPDAYSAATTYASQGFKVADNISLATVWLKLYKVGNPAVNFQVAIEADNAGVPNGNTPIANGVSNPISGKVFTSKADGEWYPFTFAVPPALVAGTQYHLVLSRTDAGFDGSNYVTMKCQSGNNTYPHGYLCNGTNANPPVYTKYTTYCMMFMLQPVPVNAFMQTGGHFDAQLKFQQGSPINQSKALCQPLCNFFDGKVFTALHRISSPTISMPIADYLYGIDHDRLLVSLNNLGYAQVQLWDTTGNLTTVTGNTAINIPGMSDVAVVGRFKNDGQDYLQVWVAGALQAQVTLQSFNMSNNWKQLGTAWLGGGMAGAPVWTQALTMGTLPSANGWTWAGTGAEANCMSIQNGKLYQNKDGYVSGDTGYYQKTGIGFNNANGWEVEWKGRVVNSTNTSYPSGGSEIAVVVMDGTKSVYVEMQEYFISVGSASGTVDFVYQADLKSQERVFKLSGKGSDYYLYMDGKLIVDGTSKLVIATANNQIQFGDISTVANENADAIWSYFKYYNTGILNPVINSGMALHEYAYWSGDKSTYLASIYNAGTQIAVKSWCGCERNYIPGYKLVDTRRGAAGDLTTSSTSFTVFVDMEAYQIIDNIAMQCTANIFNTATGNGNLLGNFIDGGMVSYGEFMTSVGGYNEAAVSQSYNKVPLGLHKLQASWRCSAGTVRSQGDRIFFMESF